MHSNPSVVVSSQNGGRPSSSFILLLLASPGRPPPHPLFTRLLSRPSFSLSRPEKKKNWKCENVKKESLSQMLLPPLICPMCSAHECPRDGETAELRQQTHRGRQTRDPHMDGLSGDERRRRRKRANNTTKAHPGE